MCGSSAMIIARLGDSLVGLVGQGSFWKATIAVVNRRLSSGRDGGAFVAGSPPDAARATTLLVFAFGRARVEKDDLPIDSPDLIQKFRELLYYLLFHPEGRTKEQIGPALWPEASTSQLRSSFHDTVLRLRRALGGKEWVLFDKRRYAFGRSLEYFYDVECFEQNITAGRGLREEAPERAIGHLRGRGSSTGAISWKA